MTAGRAKAGAKTSVKTPRRPAATRRVPAGSLQAAVARDVKAIAGRDRALGVSALALLALAMAREVDSALNSATQKSMCAARMMEALEALREQAPADAKPSPVDELRQRVEQKLRPRKPAA